MAGKPTANNIPWLPEFESLQKDCNTLQLYEFLVHATAHQNGKDADIRRI